MNRYGWGRPAVRLAGVGVVGVLLAALALGGCAAGQEPADAVGTWGTEAEGEPQLVLSEDGTVSGTDGCNRLTGEWSEGEDEDVTFTDLASTQMACEGVDTWLSSASTGEVEGDELVLRDADGEEIGTLARSS